ncbi:C-C motif chemokine 8-like [Rana temporaria]|uniref:C-C motif chemokine 8-like n=1 Tax=Rana temporaria TaxID=8407 RepID=UPI001AAD016F|nr:C-C motif chemokine 8-like [Rana temporaria]
MENPASFPSAFVKVPLFWSLKEDGSMWVSQCSAALHTGENTSHKDQRQPSIMCSMKIMLCMALLAAVAVVKASTDPGIFSTCCTRVSSAKSKLQIVDFLLQEANLPCVAAVMFITKEGKVLCSRPNVPWVTQKMKAISQKKEALQTKENKE